MKIFKEDEDSFAFILAPLIDVMLFVLMFFMLSYSQNSFFQDVFLPSSESSAASLDRDSVWVLDYGKEEQFFLDGKPVSAQELPGILSSGGLQSLVLRADSTLPYQKVIHAMDIIKRSGIQKIYLATQKSST